MEKGGYGCDFLVVRWVDLGAKDAGEEKGAHTVVVDCGGRVGIGQV